MNAKTANKDNARQRMVQAARELFHQQGVNATSVDQILRKSGTGKGQFTHYFKTKDNLVHAVLQDIHAWMKAADAPVNYRIKTWQDLETWLQFFVHVQQRCGCDRSCPVGTIGNDLNDEQILLRQDIRLIFEWVRGQLTRFFVERKALGEFADTIDPESLADFCIVTVQGGLLLGKINRDNTTFENAARHALDYLWSIKAGTDSDNDQ